jgi:hypothetical protein
MVPPKLVADINEYNIHFLFYPLILINLWTMSASSGREFKENKLGLEFNFKTYKANSRVFRHVIQPSTSQRSLVIGSENLLIF